MVELSPQHKFADGLCTELATENSAFVEQLEALTAAALGSGAETSPRGLYTCYSVNLANDQSAKNLYEGNLQFFIVLYFVVQDSFDSSNNSNSDKTNRKSLGNQIQFAGDKGKDLDKGKGSDKGKGKDKGKDKGKNGPRTKASGWKEKAALLCALIEDGNIVAAQEMVEEFKGDGHGENDFSTFIERERFKFAQTAGRGTAL